MLHRQHLCRDWWLTIVTVIDVVEPKALAVLQHSATIAVAENGPCGWMISSKQLCRANITP
jgi:hypothetical protein